MNWQTTLTSAIEGLIFTLPLFFLIYNMGKKQQELEDRINNNDDKIRKIEEKQDNIMIILNSIQQSIVRLETKIEMHFDIKNI